jgi:hypothetical protein
VPFLFENTIVVMAASDPHTLPPIFFQQPDDFSAVHVCMVAHLDAFVNQKCVIVCINGRPVSSVADGD